MSSFKDLGIFSSKITLRRRLKGVTPMPYNSTLAAQNSFRLQPQGYSEQKTLIS